MKFIIVVALLAHVLKIIFYYHHQKHAQFIARASAWREGRKLFLENYFTALDAWSRIKAKEINLIYELKFLERVNSEGKFLVRWLSWLDVSMARSLLWLCSCGCSMIKFDVMGTTKS
jgi:hypothetical protein